MANDRWTYQVVEIKSGLFGIKKEAIQEKLTQMGQSGWELVQALHAPGNFSLHLYFKRQL